MDFIADTSFYIDALRGRPGPAEWLLAHPGARLILTPVTYAEFLVGQPDESILHDLVGDGPRLNVDFEVARVYGRFARLLRQQGRMIGSNDLWIAALAVVSDLPVLTRNIGEFNRVPGLRVETY